MDARLILLAEEDDDVSPFGQHRAIDWERLISKRATCLSAYAARSPFRDNLELMKELEDLKTAVEREYERARRNIDDIHSVQESVWMNLAKSRALRDCGMTSGCGPLPGWPRRCAR